MRISLIIFMVFFFFITKNVYAGDPQSQTLITANWGQADGEFGLILEAEGNCPQSLAIDSEGNIAILDLVNKRVQLYSAAGKWLRKFSITCQAFDIQFYNSQIVLLAPYNYLAEQYDFQGKLLKRITISRDIGFLDGLRVSNQKVFVQTIDQTQYNLMDQSLSKPLPQISPGLSAQIPDRRFHTQWLDEHHGYLFIENSRTRQKQTINITTQDELGSLVFLDTDRKGNIFLRKELFNSRGESYFAVDKLDGEGHLLASVAIENKNIVAPFKPITIDKDGNIYFLKIGSEGLTVLRWQLEK
ncbi:MAG: hypothetical protein ONB31_02110 [candidate division KSB1 bacterium]|nr:hypothetical protein [candidate division KSB1 bacterium]MDZ7334609.1 hypothetical protein [candidate division KSB1 bacterium]MDZ7356583.1 hypothetical protein [candidate division KSB1 bacterium]MDZ7399900.1 hypothetical protein [candidate division KSB1 bacterium]